MLRLALLERDARGLVAAALDAAVVRWHEPDATLFIEHEVVACERALTGAARGDRGDGDTGVDVRRELDVWRRMLLAISALDGKPAAWFRRLAKRDHDARESLDRLADEEELWDLVTEAEIG